MYSVYCIAIVVSSRVQADIKRKILRGLAVCIALTMYGRREEADALITSLCQDKVESRIK